MLQPSSGGYSRASLHCEPAQRPIQQPTQVSDARLSLPEKYDVTPSKGSGFLLQGAIDFSHLMGAPTTERSKVATVISLLTGRALEWATAIWERGEEELDSYEWFMALFKCIFDHPVEG